MIKDGVMIYCEECSSYDCGCPEAKEIESLRQQLETEQMRNVACDVVAMADTPTSAEEARKMHPDYRSAALESVIRRVDECISLRQQLAAAQAGGNTWVLAEANEAISERDVLKQQLADSQKREVMLRDALDHANSILVESYDHVIHSVVKALAAAADLDDLVLCHAEPAAIVYREYGGNGAILQTELADDEPLYRAWKQKWEVK